MPLSETWNGIINGALQLTYNNDFKVISSNLNGNILNYQYDNDGLLTKVGDLILTRNAQNGLLKETKLGNLTTQRTHSNFAELKEEIAKYSNNELYHAYYTRDKGGRITQKQEIINGISKTFEYRYDVAGRLVEVKQDGSIIETYQYDTNGNRLNNNAIYDDQDRLLQYGSNSYTYSQNGDLKTKDNISFNYDVFGNLRNVTLPEKTIDYIIDARNRRIGKKINGQLVQGFLYSGKLKPIAELDGIGNIVARFIYASKINVPDYIIKGNKTYRVVSDHLGSPRLIIDISDGTIAQQIDYNTFGNILFDSNPNFQPFGFAGGLNDNETGLIRFGARDYDPQTGRWTIKDPIGLAAGTNVFIYVGNDPVNKIDPSGLWDLAEAIGVTSIGLNNALEASKATDEARKATDVFEKQYHTNPSEREGGRTDAYRHCTWSCLMTQAIGEDNARIVGNAHEWFGDSSLMDMQNNEIGRELGTAPSIVCSSECGYEMPRLVIQKDSSGRESTRGKLFNVPIEDCPSRRPSK